jgi:DNA-binding transcriptional LysR family regulator
MELHQVKYFLVLAHSLNFTRAAEQCGLTQPGLTKAIQKLEYELGGELILRERQLTQLTDLGKLVLPMLRQTMEAAEAASANATEFRKKTDSPLRIALAPTVSASLLIEPIQEIARAMPYLRVELVEVATDGLSEKLLNGEADAAIAGEESESTAARIDHWRLFDDRVVVLAPAWSDIAQLPSVSLDLLNQSVWLECLGSPVLRKLWAVCFPFASEPEVKHRGTRAEDMQHLAAAGLGIMLSPEHSPVLPSLVARPIDGNPIRQQVDLLTPCDRRSSPALSAFVKMAKLYNWATGFPCAESGAFAPSTANCGGAPSICTNYIEIKLGKWRSL